MDQDELPIFERQFDLLPVCLDLIARYAIEPDLADAQYRRAVEKFRNPLQHFAREFAVVGFLRIHGEPGVMLDAILSGSARLEAGKLPEVILDALRATAIPSGPKSRLGNGDATGESH